MGAEHTRPLRSGQSWSAVTEAEGTAPYPTVEYRSITFRDAKERGWPDTDEDDDYHDLDYTSILYRFEDGVPVAVIGTDGGEPEDQTLRRDWRWVTFALQAAYDLGRSHQEVRADG